MDSASDATRRRYARRAHSISCLLAALLALSLAGPAAAQMPEMPPMPELPEPPQMQPECRARCRSPPSTRVSRPPSVVGWLRRQSPWLQWSPSRRALRPIPPPAGPQRRRRPSRKCSGPTPAPAPPTPVSPAPAPAPPTHLNLDLRVLSPGDNGGVSTPGLNGGTGASPGMPEDWTWNWNWDLPGCESNSGPSTAGWNWNWNWGCGGATELPTGTDARELLELVADQLPTAAPDLAAPDLEGPGMPPGEDADTNVRAGVSDEGGAPSGGRHTVPGAPAGPRSPHRWRPPRR